MDDAAYAARQLAHRAMQLPVVETLVERLTADGHDVLLVGGLVRDELDGGDGNDFDVATDATPDELREAVGDGVSVIPTGEAHGTVTVHRPLDPTAVEVTTFRHDTYDGGSRRPHVTFSQTFAEDALRRDFTLNAIGVRLPSGELVDPTGGAADLAAGVLRTPRDPHTAFMEDPLRVLRMVRLAAVRGWEPTSEVEDAARALAHRVADPTVCAVERRTAELDKVLVGPPDALARAYTLADRAEVLDAWVGDELSVADPKRFDHAELTAPQRLAGLAWQVSQERRRPALESRKLPSKRVHAACVTAELIDAASPLAARRAGGDATRDAAAVAAAAGVAAADQLASLAATYDDTVGVPMPVNGDDLIEELGVAPGPHIGAALRAVETWLLDAPTDRRDDRAGALQIAERIIAKTAP